MGDDSDAHAPERGAVKRSILDQLDAAAKHQTADSAPILSYPMAAEITPQTSDGTFSTTRPEFDVPEDRGVAGAIPMQVSYAWSTRLLVHTLGRADEVRQYESPEAGPSEARWCRTVIPDWGGVPDHCTCQVYMLSRA